MDITLWMTTIKENLSCLRILLNEIHGFKHETKYMLVLDLERYIIKREYFVKSDLENVDLLY